MFVVFLLLNLYFAFVAVHCCCHLSRVICIIYNYFVLHLVFSFFILVFSVHILFIVS